MLVIAAEATGILCPQSFNRMGGIPVAAARYSFARSPNEAERKRHVGYCGGYTVCAFA